MYVYSEIGGEVTIFECVTVGAGGAGTQAGRGVPPHPEVDVCVRLLQVRHASPRAGRQRLRRGEGAVAQAVRGAAEPEGVL